MNSIELNDCLLAAGCNPENYAIESRGSYSGSHLLHFANGLWQVCYTERGCNDAPTFTSPDEAAACTYFYNFVMGIRHDHCVGFFRTEATAAALSNQLSAYNMTPHTDQIPYNGPHDPRFRVFVVGIDIFKARHLLGEALPLQG